MAHTLKDLLSDFTLFPVETSLDQPYRSVQMDSRKVQSGDVFVAITCDASVDHIQTAIQSGASCIVLEQDLLQREGHLLSILLSNTPHVLVDNARKTLGILAFRLYPSQPKVIYAVTGTNGKSSVVTFLRQMLGLLGHSAASYGTVGLETDVASVHSLDLPKLTTLDALSLHQLLDSLASQGLDHFAFEASSHGLDQYRLHQVKVTVAAFTNLTQDHLDYHETMDAYFEAKSRLFTQVLVDGGTAVINGDSPYAKSLDLMLKNRPITLLTYGVTDAAGAGYDIEARSVRLEPGSIVFDLYQSGDFVRSCRLSIVGNFQVENILCMLGMVLGGVNQGRSTPLTLKDILGDSSKPDILSQLTGARGRMEFAGESENGASIYVDYAHTPDALSRALQALRLHLVNTRGRLHVVFGCGGNRDALKRHEMGKIAYDLADHVIVTDDNPRDEDPEFIRAQILAGCPNALGVPDRHVAIRTAMNRLGQGDILLVAGKGHETGQIIRGKVLPFDDVAVVEELLELQSKL